MTTPLDREPEDSHETGPVTATTWDFIEWLVGGKAALAGFILARLGTIAAQAGLDSVQIAVLADLVSRAAATPGQEWVVPLTAPEAGGYDQETLLVVESLDRQGVARLVNDTAAAVDLGPLLAAIATMWSRSSRRPRSTVVAPAVDHLEKVYRYAEKLLGRPLTISEIEAYRRWHEEYELPLPVIVALLEEAYVKREKKHLSYVETIARSWYDRGVRTMDDVDRVLREHQQVMNRYGKIIRYLSLDRLLTVPEQELLQKWSQEWGFSDEVIMKACSTVVNTNRPNFAYIDRVLQRWYQEGVRTVEDAEKAMAEIAAGKESGTARRSKGVDLSKIPTKY